MYKFHRNLWGKFKMRELNSLGIWMSGFHIFSTGFRVELGPDHRHEWAGTAPVPASAQQKCELLTQQETIVYKCSNEDMVNDFFANVASKVFSQFTYWERSFWSKWWRIEPASLELTPLAARNSRNAAFSPGSKSLNTERQTLSWSASDFEQTKPRLKLKRFLDVHKNWYMPFGGSTW